MIPPLESWPNMDISQHSCSLLAISEDLPLTVDLDSEMKIDEVLQDCVTSEIPSPAAAPVFAQDHLYSGFSETLAQATADIKEKVIFPIKSGTITITHPNSIKLTKMR